MRATIKERLIAHSKLDTRTGCLIWLGSRNERGYGRVWFEGRMQRVNRVSLRILKCVRLGKRLALHDCDNPRCFHPDHLHAGSSRQNAIESVERKRHVNARKTRCKRGHRFTRANTRIRAAAGRVWRACRKCEA